MYPIIEQFIGKQVTLRFQNDTEVGMLRGVNHYGIVVETTLSNRKGYFFYPWSALTDGIDLTDAYVETVNKAA